MEDKNQVFEFLDDDGDIVSREKETREKAAEDKNFGKRGIVKDNRDFKVGNDTSGKEKESTKKAKKDGGDGNSSKGKKALRICLRVTSVIGVTLVLIVAALYGVCFVLVKGPSETAKNQFVFSVKETSAMGWVAHLYLSNAEIEEIINSRGIIEVDEGTVSNPGLIEIPKDDEDNKDEDKDTPDIEVLDVRGSTYRGKLLIVKDPSRVFVGTVPKFFEGKGMVVQDIAERYGAVAGINGGEFYDVGSHAYTALPVGCVIQNGELTFGSMDKTYNISGFTKDNVFVIGKMTAKEAIEMGVRDAVHTKWETGPFLVLNGEALTVPDTSVYGGGKNPRTAIGQRADGAVLLLVVDGRQANSIGATFEELAYIMLEYGAVNASAMDGGTSTQMVYEGEVINSPYSPTGPRRCPTSFLVAPLTAE